MLSQRVRTWGFIFLLLALGAQPAVTDEAADPAVGLEAALAPLRAEYAAEEAARAEDVAALRENKEASSAELQAAVREVLRGLDDIGRGLATKEIELARAYAAQDRPVDACLALSRALGYDLSLLDAARGDEALAPIRNHPDFDILLRRATSGRGHLDTGDPFEYEYHEREHRMRLRIGHGDTALGRPTPAIAALRTLVSQRVDAPAPAQLTFANYDQLVRLSLIRRHTHYGWPYRHAALFEADRDVADIAAKATARFEERKDEQDGPYWAYLSFFPAAHTGRFQHVQSVLAYLEERAPFLFTRALEGLAWILDGYAKHGAAVPGTSPDQTRTLLEETKRQVEDAQLWSDRFMAWTAWPKGMYYLGSYHLYGMRGLAKNPDRGLQWLRGAAELGVAWAVRTLANCYLSGNGVEKDPARAVELARTACDEDPDAMHLLAHCYHYGLGVEQDMAKARELYTKAGKGGVRWSMEALGVLFHRGLGGERDYEAARQWYQQGIAAGNPRCVRRMGNLAIDRRQGEADLVKASEWLADATKQVPDDLLTLVYVWTAFHLRGMSDEARAAAKAFLDSAGPEGAVRDLALAMKSSSCLTSKALRRAKKIEDEAARTMLIGRIHYVDAMRDLAKGKASSAKRAFQRVLKEGYEDCSTSFSAQLELERLQAEEK